ncbi:AraC family ligand binding domain-containing protein [Streptomyces sp. SAJ15]|uniref:AraC family transcriptional regulator n=1 Tax=Streptomyces sp. SAJ15 TaxID=2011095 RepID=UPI0011848EDA|nr:AraC family ligand binding domain-containing protein [Streptomyces sp. SAJ15]TVL90011.1 AraC family transcriptional regulator [Streptomyces sp. SAJ15]
MGVHSGDGRDGWARYWRDPERPVEAMHAHFFSHRFHRHSHDAYSFAVTEVGAQRFRCRGAVCTSGAGMVMAFNPDDPHDGEAAAELGYQYRIVYLGPAVVRELLADLGGDADRPVALPLFDRPVSADPRLGAAVSRLHTALLAGPAAGPLVRDERLTAAVTAMVRHGATRAARVRAPGSSAGQAVAARRARAVLEETYAEEVPAQALAEAAGCSRFALYRAFRAEYGLAPSDFQRQLRLRRARRLLAAGRTAAEAAGEAGFVDQSHLHRWFVRSYGVTPGVFQRATGIVARTAHS